jgi:hypothetical protein
MTSSFRQFNIFSSSVCTAVISRLLNKLSDSQLPEKYFAPVTITVLDIIHHPVFDLKHDVSETGFCLRLLAGPTQLSPIDRLRQRLAQVPPEGGERIQSPKRLILNKRLEYGKCPEL